MNDVRTLDFFEVIFRDLFDVLQDRLQLDDPRHLPLHNGALKVGWEREWNRRIEGKEDEIVKWKGKRMELNELKVRRIEIS